MDTTQTTMDPEINIVKKGLTFTKSAYESLVADLWYEVEHSKVKGSAYHELYGMYYCAVIGLIRAGALCTRVTGKDGFPEIRVEAGSRYYKCREDVIYSLIGAEEANDLITPYSDTADSYVKNLEVKPVVVKEEVVETRSTSGGSSDKTLRKELEALRKEKKAVETAAQAKYDELNARYQKALEANKDIPVVASAEDAEAVAKYQAEAELLRVELDDWRKRCTEAENKATESSKKAQKLQNKLNEKEEEAKKYVYDPNYDHYYNDELPVILENLEFNHTGTVIRTITMVACFAGIAFCLLMFI